MAVVQKPENPPGVTVDLDWDTDTPIDYQWTKKAFILLEEEKLVVDIVDREGIRSVTGTGECPRCGHDVHYFEVLNVLLPPTGAVRQITATPEADSGFKRVDVRCECEGTSHSGRPADKTCGCGIIFVVNAKIRTLR